MNHYANAFTLYPGRCFRLVQLDGVGHPMHCTEPVAWHGRFRAADERLYRVDACEDHAGDLGAPLVDLRPQGEHHHGAGEQGGGHAQE